MPANKKNEDKTPSLDDLLNFGDADVSQPAVADEVKAETLEASQIAPASSEDTLDLSANEAVRVESFESAEIAALRAEVEQAKLELAKSRTHPTDDEGRPLPEESLTDEQREIRNLQDQLARAKGKNIDEALKEEIEEVGEDGVLIHVLEDGLTAMARVLYRGEEVVFGPRAYSETLDRNGRSWLNMTDDEQYDRWGVVRFRKGPWPGKKKYEDKDAESKSIRSVAPVVRF